MFRRPQGPGQLGSRPFRAYCSKSAGLALVILSWLGAGLQRLFAGPWPLAEAGWRRRSHSLGTRRWAPGLVLTILASLGVVAGMVFLMPAVTSLVAAVFADEIAEQVERTHYPDDPPGTALPIPRAVEGGKTALLSLAVYVCAVPFLLVAGLGAVLVFLATAYLLSREYFLLAAMRFRSPAEAKALRREHAGTIFVAGLMIAAFVSIPILNLATPLFATALMVHIHKRLSTASRRVSTRRSGPRSALRSWDAGTDRVRN